MRSIVALVLLTLAAGPVHSQIPETFTNLKVLPNDIDRRELIATMRDFASSLGVRCEFCHVGEGGPTLANMDFASDEKESKRAAPRMFEMVRVINGDHLEKLDRPAPSRVGCFTCHHRLSRPGRIESEVEATLQHSGIERAVDRYRELRNEHYGSSAYDFGVGPLNGLGERLLAQGKPTDAVAVLELNAQFLPDSGWLQHLLGEAYLATGDREKARAAFEKSLALEPANGQARKRLQELGPSEPRVADRRLGNTQTLHSEGTPRSRARGLPAAAARRASESTPTNMAAPEETLSVGDR